MSYPMPDSPLFAKVVRTIDPRCEMYAFAAKTSGAEQAQRYYFHSAAFLVERLVGVIEAGGRKPADLALLDFAGGYGRFTRFFVPLFRRVAMADLDPDMVEFCRCELGAEAFLSSTDPAAIDPRPDFDVVFAFSLFTHLPASLWRRWLRVLWDFLRPGGLLVFSTRSPALARSMDADPPAQAAQRAVVEAPRQPLSARTLQLFGLRLSVAAAARERVAGTIRARVRIAGAAPTELGAVELEELRVPGVDLGPAVAAVEPEADAQLVTVSIPFRSYGPVRAMPIGAVKVPMWHRFPSVARAEDCSDSPSIEIDARSRAQGGADPGISFQPSNETSGRIDRACYGSTTVTLDYVRAAVRELPGSSGTEHFRGGEMDLFQEVFVVAKDR